MELRLLLLGALALAPISTIILLEQHLLLEPILRDSNPLKFVLLVVGWLGLGAIVGAVGGYGVRLAGRVLGASRFTEALRLPLVVLFSVAGLAGGLMFWGRQMH